MSQLKGDSSCLAPSVILSPNAITMEDYVQDGDMKIALGVHSLNQGKCQVPPSSLVTTPPL